MLKKLVLIGTTLSIFTLPLIANAELITTNNTDQWSSVIITTHGNRCSGAAADGVTNPHSTTHTTPDDVKMLCGTTPCRADIIMETSLDAAKKCSGVKIGTAVLNDFNTDVVDSISEEPNSAYTLSGAKTNHVFIDKK